MARYDVFISYSRKESLWRSKLVNRLVEMASDRDVDVFVDEHSISPGSDWGAEIERAVDRAEVAVVLASTAWGKSEYCQQELRLALQAKKYVVWTSIDGCQPKQLSKINGSVISKGGLCTEPNAFVDTAMTTICEAILDRLDPYQRKLQAKLPRKLRLIRRLGEGSTCVVYMAADTTLDRRLSIRMVKNPEDKDKFDRSVMRAARLGRQHRFVTVFGASLDNNPHYCVEEFVSGKTLAEHLSDRTWRWNAEDTVKLALQVAEVLVAAHGQGVLSPSVTTVEDIHRRHERTIHSWCGQSARCCRGRTLREYTSKKAEWQA